MEAPRGVESGFAPRLVIAGAVVWGMKDYPGMTDRTGVVPVAVVVVMVMWRDMALTLLHCGEGCQAVVTWPRFRHQSTWHSLQAISKNRFLLVIPAKAGIHCVHSMT